MSGTVRFRVRLTPRGGADRIEGVGPAGELRIRVRPAPVEGAANEALLRLLAGALGVGRTQLSLERGATARLKVVSAEGVEQAPVLQRWPRLLIEER